MLGDIFKNWRVITLLICLALALVALRPSPKKAKCYWIAIACSHHDLNDMDLYHIALQLKIAKENLFIMASAVGKRGIVQQLLYDKSQNSVDWNEIKHKNSINKPPNPVCLKQNRTTFSKSLSITFLLPY